MGKPHFSHADEETGRESPFPVQTGSGAPAATPMVLCRLTAGCLEARGGAHPPDFLCVPKESQQRKGTPRRARGHAAGSLRASTGGGRLRTRPALPGSDSARSIRRRPSVLGTVEGKSRSPSGGSNSSPSIGPRAGLLRDEVCRSGALAATPYRDVRREAEAWGNRVFPCREGNGQGKPVSGSKEQRRPRRDYLTVSIPFGITPAEWSCP